MLAAGRIKCSRHEIEIANSGILDGALLIGITSDQRVAGIYLVIEPGADLSATRRQRHNLIKRNDIELRIEYDCINRTVVVNLTPFNVNKE